MQRGRVVGFDGRRVHAWVHTGVRIDLYIDRDLFNGEVNYRDSPNPGVADVFVDIGLDPRRAETPCVEVLFSDTHQPLDVAPPLVGFINRRDFAPIDLFCDYFARIPDQPYPPDAYSTYVGGGGREGFLKTGARTFLNLFHYGMLEGDGRQIVDLGCGCGRVALPLGPFLTVNDTYVGYDTWRAGIDWAQKNISERYPHLSFHWLPQPEQAGRAGYQADKVFQLPLPDEVADSVIALSVFTHLRMAAAESYLREIFRILKPGGRAYLTWFLVSGDEDWLFANRTVDDESEDGWFTVDQTYVDAYFRESRVLDMIEAIGFRLALKAYGYWGARPESEGSREGQDLLILLKPTPD